VKSIILKPFIPHPAALKPFSENVKSHSLFTVHATVKPFSVEKHPMKERLLHGTYRNTSL
jgi:hypothetical protein